MSARHWLDGFVAWPDEAARRYRARGHWQGLTLGEAFDTSVAAHRERVAVVDGARRLTYGQLGALVDRLALHLAERGIHSGARAIFQLPNSVDFIVAYVACLKVGAIPVACLPAHRHAEIGHVGAFTEAAAWFTASDVRGFDSLAMVQAVRETLPAVREVFVAGEGAGVGTTGLADLLRDRIEDRRALASLDALQPAPSVPAVFQLSG